MIPFPRVDGIPRGCESTDQFTSKDQFLPFLRASLELKNPFESFLRDIIETGSPPICVITDMFLGWALDICESLSVPGLIFHSMTVLSSTIARMGFLHAATIKSASETEHITLPGLEAPFPLARSDFPEVIIDNNPIIEFLMEIGDVDRSCSGYLINSFEELDGGYLGLLKSTYQGDDTKAWCVGPLLLYDDALQGTEHEFPTAGSKRESLTTGALEHEHVQESEVEAPEYIKWLDRFDEPDSVIYISFGTQAYMSDNRMDEVVLGLAMANHPFLWVVKSDTWRPPTRWEEFFEGKGLVVREWVEQRRILAHPAIGGFFSHCGWNSTLESLTAGVPLLCWPMGAEQPLNMKLVVNVLEAGVSIYAGKDHGEIVESDDIRDGIKKLMGEMRGKLARERAREISRMARRAVQEGGSSSKNLDLFIKCLTDSGTNGQIHSSEYILQK